MGVSSNQSGSAPPKRKGAKKAKGKGKKKGKPNPQQRQMVVYAQPKPKRRNFQRGGATIDYASGPLKQGSTPLKAYIDKTGKRIQPFHLCQIVSSVIPDGAGLLGVAGSVPTDTGIALNTPLLARIATLAPMYDRCRLRSLQARYQPSIGTAKDGSFVWYFDYGGDVIASSLVNASRMQQSKETVPFRGQTMVWHKQDPEDDLFIKTAGTLNFNSIIQHRLYLVGEGLLPSTRQGYIWISAIVEFTGEQ